MEHETRKSLVIPAVLLVVGGAMIITSYFFKWGQVAATQGDDQIYIKGKPAVLVAGIVAVLLGIALWAIRNRSARIVLSILAIVGGLLAVVVAGIKFPTSSIRNTLADELGDKAGVSHAEAEKDLAASEGAGRIKTTREPGVYFALAGGILVLIGGVGGLVSGMRRTTPEAVPEGEFPAPYPTAPPPPANGEQTAQIASSPAEGPGSEPAPPPPPAQPMPPTPSDTDPAPPPRETEPPEQG